MALTSGTRLGPYEILSPIGKGGMGEVYKAKDTRLDRTVAIKVLPDHFAESPERKARFEREAKAISQLNHPHICTLHDVGEQGGTDYLVMEYIEGETLAERLKKGPLPLDQVLEYGIQIADGLDNAHRAGIVHRDLKPGNVMLTKSGTKLLDFGLAKPNTERQPSLEALSAMPTREKPITEQGVVVGTVQYMAPEQLEGKEADARTDLFAFGTLLYEMVTGKKAFEGKSQLSVMTAILEKDPPPLSSTQSMSPKALDYVVKTCFEKNPDNRWHSAGDVGRQLSWIAGTEAESPVASTEPMGWRRTIMVSIAASLLVGLFVGLAVWMLGGQQVKPVSRFVIPVPESEPLEITGGNTDVAISPDGSTIVYVATRRRQLFVRPLDQIEATPLRGTEGGYTPFFSPDAEWIAYRNWADGTLSKVSVQGGPPLMIYELSHADDLRGASWGPDDTIIFGTQSEETGLLQVPAAGGEPVVITTPGRRQGRDQPCMAGHPPGRPRGTVYSPHGLGHRECPHRSALTRVGRAEGALSRRKPPALRVDGDTSFMEWKIRYEPWRSTSNASKSEATRSGSWKASLPKEPELPTSALQKMVPSSTLRVVRLRRPAERWFGWIGRVVRNCWRRNHSSTCR